MKVTSNNFREGDDMLEDIIDDFRERIFYELDQLEVDDIEEALWEIKEEYDLPISMIVVDTLSKASVGYDENSSKEVLIQSAKLVLRSISILAA